MTIGPQPAAALNPATDWITQRALAKLLGVSERTATAWTKEGCLRQYEHGVPGCGRRKYSRARIEAVLRRSWASIDDAPVAACTELQGVTK